MLVQFHRHDFVTITVCALGFFFLERPEHVRRMHFRMLVLLMFGCLGLDAIWFTLNRDHEEKEDGENGGVEASVSNFSRKMSYLAFIWKIITAIVLWKASMDFV